MAGAVLLAGIPVRSIVPALLITTAPHMSNPWAAKSFALVAIQTLDLSALICGPLAQRVSDR